MLLPFAEAHDLELRQRHASPATGTKAPRAAVAQAPGLSGTGIDHLSILVTDLQRSAAFYQSLFGMTPLSEDRPNQILRLGMKRTIVSLRHEGPSGVVDHFAIGVENFNREAVTAQLKQRGLFPSLDIARRPSSATGYVFTPPIASIRAAASSRRGRNSGVPR